MGSVRLRPSTDDDIPTLLAGRDEASRRFLGDADAEPRPVACIVVDEQVVGWVDHDVDRPWLEPGEVNLGYCVFPAFRGRGYASRAVRLLLRQLAQDGRWQVATLLIHPDNERSLALARRLGFTPSGDIDGNPYWKRPVSPRNLERLNRIYGPATWDVYERLDRSLDPRGPDRLHEIAGELLHDGDVVLDAGCRDAAHLIRLVEANAVTGIGVEPVALHIERAHAAVEQAGLRGRIELRHGVMHDLPYDDDHVDLVWCRDVLEQVDDLDGALAELARVTRRGGHFLVYTTFATARLDGADAEMMRRHLGNVDENLDAGFVEAAFERAGLRIERKEVIGTEWREHAEERTQPVSRALLRLARLRRQGDDIVAEHGQDIYDHIEANLHWEVFQFLEKLEPVVYVLARP